MSLIAKENIQSEYPQVPTGVHKARCVKIIDLGTQKQDYQGDISWKKQFMIIWEIPEYTNNENEPLTLSKFYTLSLHEKSNLAKDLQSWKGKAISSSEKKGFDITSLLGDACQLNVIEGKNGRPKISNVMKIKDTDVSSEQIIPSFFFSLAEYQKGNKEKFNQLSEGIRNIVLKAREFDDTDHGTSDMNHDTNVPF